MPLLLIYGLLINGFTWYEHHRDFPGLLFNLLTVLVLLKFAIAFWGFWHALKAKLVSPLFVGGYVALWLLGAGALYSLAYIEATRGIAEVGEMILVPAALLVLPLARIALSPLALAMNRHR